MPPAMHECTHAYVRMQAGGDVYQVEPKPLKEGEEKHIISVFVADEAGLINRVAGVFARRGVLGARAGAGDEGGGVACRGRQDT